MTGADLFIKALMDRGVETIYTLSGNGTEPFYEACKRAEIRVVDFRNEQAAIFAADASARLTRRLAVCAVSAAVGHANAMIGLVNAWFDGAPVLLFSGSSQQTRTDQGKFQDMDQIPLVASVCKYARLVDQPQRIPFYVSEACARATSGRPGPVHLTIPADVLAASVSPPPAQRPARAAHGQVRPLAGAAPAAITDAAALIAQSERPVLIAGSGAFYAGAAEALAEFAALTATPVVVPIWDRGTIDRPTRNFLGVIGAASGGPRVLPDADLAILVGARVDYRMGYGEPPSLPLEARIIRIDVDAGEIRQGLEPDLAILADPRSALMALTVAVRERGIAPRRAWLEEVQRRDSAFRQPWRDARPASGPIDGRQILEALRPFIDDDAIFLVDGGNIGQWAHALADRYPGHWLTCGASGVVGWGIAGAIAAKLNHPDRPVILLSGDGAIGFGLPELETAVRNRTPFVIVLADDRAWGSVAEWQAKTYGPDGFIASRLGPVAYDQVAEGFGALGLRVERAEDLTPAIRQGLASGRPTLIHVPTQMGGPIHG